MLVQHNEQLRVVSTNKSIDMHYPFTHEVTVISLPFKWKCHDIKKYNFNYQDTLSKAYIIHENQLHDNLDILYIIFLTMLIGATL